MSFRVRSCPHLCARVGVTRRHEVTVLTRARRAIALCVVVALGMFGTWWRACSDRLLRTSLAPRYVASVGRRVIDTCGIRLEVTGVRANFADPGEPVLVVGNHVSWLDVLALTAVQPVRMVSKAEIGRWPVIGAMGRAARTIFIDRFAPRSVARTRTTVAEALRGGEIIATFPEATTTCGRGVGAMYPAMFQTAIDANVSVQPVALMFLDRAGALTTAGAYVGDQPLLESIRTIIGQRDLRLRIEILPRISAKHVRPIDHRGALRDAAHASIGEALIPVIGSYQAHRRPTTCQAASPTVRTVSDPLTQLDAITAHVAPR